MPDDPRRPTRLSELSPQSREWHDNPGPDDGVRPPATVFDRLFPTDTDQQISWLFGFEQKRNATRMRTGLSRIPPRIAEKVETQIAAKEALARDIVAALDRADAAGIHANVMRYVIRSVMESERLERDDEPL